MAELVHVSEMVRHGTCRGFQRAKDLDFFAQKILKETLRKCGYEKRVLRGTISRGG